MLRDFPLPPLFQPWFVYRDVAVVGWDVPFTARFQAWLIQYSRFK